MPRTRTSRPPRPPALVLLTALIAAAALVVPTTGASAGPAPTPAPPKITVTPVTNILDLPVAEGTPEVLIQANKAFPVTVVLVDGVYSKTDDLSLTLTATNGSFVQTARVTIAAGASSTKDDLLPLRTANTVGTASRVVLTAQPVDRKAQRDLGSGSSVEFDVVTDPKPVPLTIEQRNQSLLVSKEGVGVPCQPTSDPGQQTCVDLVLPQGVDSNVFFATGACDGAVNCGKQGSLLQALAKIEGPYSKASPATLVVKCDKSLCGTGAIQRNVLYGSLAKTGPLASLPACPAKGTIGSTQESCVDYVQSKRDGSGDTYLYWLVTRDARTSH